MQKKLGTRIASGILAALMFAQTVTTTGLKRNRGRFLFINKAQKAKWGRSSRTACSVLFCIAGKGGMLIADSI